MFSFSVTALSHSWACWSLHTDHITKQASKQAHSEPHSLNLMPDMSNQWVTITLASAALPPFKESGQRQSFPLYIKSSSVQVRPSEPPSRDQPRNPIINPCTDPSLGRIRPLAWFHIPTSTVSLCPHPDPIPHLLLCPLPPSSPHPKKIPVPPWRCCFPSCTAAAAEQIGVTSRRGSNRSEPVPSGSADSHCELVECVG